MSYKVKPITKKKCYAEAEAKIQFVLVFHSLEVASPGELDKIDGEKGQ